MSRTGSSSASSSSSLIKLDELSSFGATRQNRLPALIKLNEIDLNLKQQSGVANAVANSSLPIFSTTQTSTDKRLQSLPVDLQQTSTQITTTTSYDMNNTQAEKENVVVVDMVAHQAVEGGQVSSQQQDDILKHSKAGEQQQQATGINKDESGDDFQVVDMEQVIDDESSMGVGGPSLPQSTGANRTTQLPQQQQQQQQLEKSIQALQASQFFNQQPQQQSLSTSNLGDSLIEMIINLRNENQNLIKALETNNDYVKERLSEFKRIQDETRKREAQFALEKADHEHQIRKLQRQNTVLSERLKGMEVKLKEMKLDVSESLSAAHSSKVSSIRQDQPDAATAMGKTNLYPELDADLDASFSNLAYPNQSTSAEANTAAAATMQIDATSGELYNNSDKQDKSSSSSAMQTDHQMDAAASRIANMSKEELEKHFDAEKVKFYALDDPMKQVDKLEQQLNDIGKRDYEICLLQQQLNIYRQDFRLERMANYEAKIQIEKLKNEIDKLCLDRIQETHDEETQAKELDGNGGGDGPSSNSRQFEGAPENLLGRLGRKAAKTAARSAAKAAKYAAKQAHLEEKAAKAMARVAGTASSTPSHHHHHHHHQAHNHSGQQQPTAPAQPPPSYPLGPEPTTTTLGSGEYHNNHHHHARRGHRHQNHGAGKPRAGAGMRSEMVNDLLSTANKAMLTGYKMASTHVNLALDKLSQYEQEQRDNLEKAKQQQPTNAAPSAPQMQPPSID